MAMTFEQQLSGAAAAVANLKAAIALHFCYYNFVKIHGSLRVSPAMEAGVTNKLWDLEELIPN